MLALDKLVLEPGVALVAATLPIVSGLEQAISLSGIEEIAERNGTPLNELMGRVLNRTDPIGDKNGVTGAGDDIAEFGGRQCYRSWAKGRPQDEYIANVIKECHGSIFRHATLVFQITGVSRSLSHELVRHGIGTAPSQESQRYVNAKDVRFVVPPITRELIEGMTPEEMDKCDELTFFRESCQDALDNYANYQERLKKRLGASHERGDYKGATSYQKRANEAARSLLPNAAETRLLFSMNLQSSRHILSLRGSEYADLEIRRLAVKLLEHSRDYAPAFYADVNESLGADGLAVVEALNGKL
jgi:thymidylate synthase (FAD)